MTKKRLEQLQNGIATIKVELAAIDDLRPGSLTRQYKDPKTKRGPYYQLSYTRAMKSRTQYVPRHCVGEVRRQIGNWALQILDRKVDRFEHRVQPPENEIRAQTLTKRWYP